MRDDFFGVYVTPEREIRIDKNASVADLLYVIGKLADEIEVWRNRCLRRPFPVQRRGDSASESP